MNLTLEEAAAFVHCHPDTLRKLAADGQCPAATKIGRAWIFPEHLLQRWVDQRCESTATAGAASSLTGGQRLAARLAARRKEREQRRIASE